MGTSARCAAETIHVVQVRQIAFFNDRFWLIVSQDCCSISYYPLYISSQRQYTWLSK